MSYPDYPDNRLIINGVDITETYGMILLDGYTLEPPEPKTYVVNIPGGNGKLDLTESLLGDAAYNNRNQTFSFAVINPKDFEAVKTKVSNFLHGRAYDYKMTMDPEYRYHGRFRVTGYDHSSYMNGKVGTIKISIDADPFKYKEKQFYEVDAIGGKEFIFESGRKRVQPVIETDGFIKVIFNNTLYTLPSGTWKLSEVTFQNGDNKLYINSYDVHSLTWKGLKDNGITWGKFGQKRLFEWYKSGGDETMVPLTWNDVSDKTWSKLTINKWSDLVTLKSIEGLSANVKEVKITYEWGDL